eukprot:181201-Pyramimonas_sp.AAC.1
MSSPAFERIFPLASESGAHAPMTCSSHYLRWDNFFRSPYGCAPESSSSQQPQHCLRWGEGMRVIDSMYRNTYI